MDWLLLATGATGGWTLLFVLRLLYRRWGAPPSIAVYHSPQGGCTGAILAELARARQEILVQAYSFTSKPIAEALVAAKTRGVHVEILLDRSNEQETCAAIGSLLEEGLAPRLDADHGRAHNKVIVIDRRTVITGSFDFTPQAEAENAENLLVIKGHPEVARSYRDRFMAHREHCEPSTMKASKEGQRKAG
jgi:phosphatidylserine/phosphatidylglycerophosphate/cardiolipin synthase-like enzyme